MRFVMYKGNSGCIIRYRGMIETYGGSFFADWSDYYTFTKEVI